MKTTISKQIHRINFLGLIVILAVSITISLILFTKVTHAASLSAKNQKAHTVYLKKLRKLGKNGASYKFVDLTGDGLHEALAEYDPGNMGSGRYFEIYTYKKGKAVRILKFAEYGLTKVMSYPKTKAVVIYCSGHGGEHYEYFRYKGGKYSYVAGKGRSTMKSSSSWNYYRSNNNYTSYSQNTFLTKVKKLTVGKKKTYSVWGWKFASR